jgi:hypothetical protein
MELAGQGLSMQVLLARVCVEVQQVVLSAHADARGQIAPSMTMQVP